MSLLLRDGETLVTYYLLPIVDVNKLTFGSKFVNSFVSKDGTKIYVELKGNLRSPGLYRNKLSFSTEVVIKGTLFIIFKVSEEFIIDVVKFLRGNYSEMQRNTKKLIYASSSLPYNKTMGSFKNTHPILQALDKTKTLRSYLIDELGVVTLPDSVELITKPEDHWFIENRLK